jgi:small-conductance mechanosensitive channel
MARILTAGIVGLLSFGLAAGGSIFLQKSKTTETVEADVTDPTQDTTSGSTNPGSTFETDSTSVELPIAVRATPASPEEIVRYGMTFQKREEALKQREEELRQERLRLKLVSEDVRAEQRELEGLEQQIRGKLVAAEGVLKQIGDQQQEMKKQQEEAKTELDKFDKLQTQVDEGEEANIKKMSDWFQAMVPEKAADYLREMVDEGQMPTAVKILANLEQRDASKILAAMNDSSLVVQLVEEFKGLRRPEKAKVR